jgi:uncharacterized protein YlaI
MTCIGYGPTEGKCENPVMKRERGKPWGAYWCESCNRVRIDTISQQFKAIEARFSKPQESPHA